MYRLSYCIVCPLCRLLCIRRRKRTHVLFVAFEVNMKSTTMYYYYYYYYYQNLTTSYRRQLHAAQ